MAGVERSSQLRQDGIRTYPSQTVLRGGGSWAPTLGWLSPVSVCLLLWIAPAAAQDEEVFVDPELEAIPAPTTRTVTNEDGKTELPDETTANVRFVLRSRFGVDTRWEYPNEDVMEATQLGLLEATVRRNRHLRFEVGIRFQHFTDIHRDDIPGTNKARFEVDVVPTAGFVDWTMVDGLHLRAGYQNTYLGRFDVLGTSDLLSIKDFRKGPTAMPEMMDVAQLAVRLDWDATSWLGFTALYLPFFQPHLMDAFGTDYALFPQTQTSPANNDPTMVQLQDILGDSLTRSGQGKLANGTIGAFTPDPDLTTPQGALRMDMRGQTGELGVTVGTALEKLPAIFISQSLQDYLAALQTDDGPSREDEIRLLATPEPFSVNYNRYYTFAVDGAMPAGPFLIGAEASFMVDRTLFAAEDGEYPDPEQVNVVTGSLRAEYTGSDEWLLAAEGLYAHTLSSPSDSDRTWLTFEQGRFFAGGLGMVGWAPQKTGLRLELGGAVFTGLSYVLAPRAEYEVLHGFFVEVGAYFVGGAQATSLGAPNLALGGLYDNVDQVFMGVRWVP